MNLMLTVAAGGLLVGPAAAAVVVLEESCRPPLLVRPDGAWPHLALPFNAPSRRQVSPPVAAAAVAARAVLAAEAASGASGGTALELARVCPPSPGARA